MTEAEVGGRVTIRKAGWWCAILIAFATAALLVYSGLYDVSQPHVDCAKNPDGERICRNTLIIAAFFEKYGLLLGAFVGIGVAIWRSLIATRQADEQRKAVEAQRKAVEAQRDALGTQRDAVDAQRKATTQSDEQHRKSLAQTRLFQAVELLKEDDGPVKIAGIRILARMPHDDDNPYKGDALRMLEEFIRSRSSSGNVKTGARIDPLVQAAVGTVTEEKLPDGLMLELHGVNLKETSLRRAHLERANLFGAHLEEAHLRNAHLKEANMLSAHLVQAAVGTVTEEKLPDGLMLELHGVNLKEANLLSAHLERANLFDAHLERANLFEAHLEEAYLGNAHLEEAHLRNAHLKEANLLSAHLEGANLVDAHLERANLFGAHLERANLFGANLEGARLHNAHLEGASLEKANLTKADVTNANFDQVRGLLQAQLDAACQDPKGCQPKNLPDDLTWNEKKAKDRWNEFYGPKDHG